MLPAVGVFRLLLIVIAALLITLSVASVTRAQAFETSDWRAGTSMLQFDAYLVDLGR